ncbi:MAG TPA: acyl-CoA dehydrogenase family protein [Polyangiaceae bacterium]|nr:acyl-CoA dehydrogenase family protein [Polyangiaceae bacterium]
MREASVKNVEAVVQEVVEDLRKTAVARDRAGGVPKRERDLLRKSGLLTLLIPREHGGLGASWADTLGVVRRVAEVDGSMAHVFGFQHLLLATIRLFGPAEQYVPLFRSTVEHEWFWGNALNPLDVRAVLEPRGADFVMRGSKSFCSGAGDSDMLVVSAMKDDGAKRLVIAAIPTRRDGIAVLGDWSNMGQRQTDSGSVDFNDVHIGNDEILSAPGPLGTPFAALRPLIAQLIFANVHLGIAQGAFEEARQFARTKGKPWFLSGVEKVSEDPYLLHHFGELFVELEATRLVTDRAAAELDLAWARAESLTASERGAVAVAVATAKVKSTKTGLDTVQRIFEVMGARATTSSEGFDRFWRNLRALTLHDPVDYKLRELGAWVFNDQIPTPTFYS